MSTYRTPDVYVEEISLFPPSVAEVETAVPAFIGYTAKADKITAGDLRKAPTKVKSLPEFESLFGGAPEVKPSEIQLDEGNNFVKATFSTTYYLYDSLRLFFDNGGGKCYIVSVGSYSDTPDAAKLKEGLDAVAKFDEPTLLLFPDAVNLAAAAFGNLQIQALAQCGKLMDRFGIFDTRSDDLLGDQLRSNIGINSLKYGAAYSPWLQIDYSKNIAYANIKGVLKKGTTDVTLPSLTIDTGIKNLIASLDNALADTTTVGGALTAAAAPSATLSAQYAALMALYKATPGKETLQNIYKFVFGLAGVADGFLGSSGLKLAELGTDIKNAVTTTLKATFNSLIANELEIKDAVSGYTVQYSIVTAPAAAEWGAIFTTPPVKSGIIPVTATTAAAKCDAVIPALTVGFSLINETLKGFITSAKSYAGTYESRLSDSFPVYKNIVRGINDTATTIPPSGAVAGVYAMIDSSRGVWKAPANVSLAGVIGPTKNFDLEETDNLNVDATAGKSINAIRAFSGKGTLIWGARTLAGNDNEWRYVNVRRFFNMVEESIKKSTYWAVFEPNDANTWVKVRGMIENYLMQKWREGALAGATPKDAFFVKCGLGVTMSAQDILEGRMNVEIGMAVVRPAEFIILKFSHKLQTS